MSKTIPAGNARARSVQTVREGRGDQVVMTTRFATPATPRHIAGALAVLVGRNLFEMLADSMREGSTADPVADAGPLLGQCAQIAMDEIARIMREESSPVIAGRWNSAVAKRNQIQAQARARR